MDKYNYKAFRKFNQSDHAPDLVESVRTSLELKDGKAQRFAKECFRMSPAGLAEKVNSMEFLLPYMPTAESHDALEFRVLFLIAEEILDIVQLDPEDFTDTIPHYAELIALRK